jgi:hypothetical protein
MAKQMIDARHVAGKGGIYVGGAGQSDPGAGGAELGLFTYATEAPWLEGHLGGSLLVSSAADDIFAGANTGVRVQTPSRVAPFVGLGGYLGVSPLVGLENAESDGIDNDDNGMVDEPHETRLTTDWFAAIYPEIGLHIWATPRMRWTGSAAYYVSTEGRDHDFWYLGAYVSWIGLRETSQWGGAKALRNRYRALEHPPIEADEIPEPLVRLPPTE